MTTPGKTRKVRPETQKKVLDICALVVELGSQAAAARKLGMSPQQINGLLMLAPAELRAKLPKGRRGRPGPSPPAPLPQGERGDVEDPRPAEILKHFPLVKRIAGVLAQKRGRIDQAEFYADGVVGLVQALRKFDPARGVSFGSFAEQRIRGAILDAWREADELGRVRRKQLKTALERAARLEQHWGRTPTYDELLEVCPDIDREMVEHAADRAVVVRLDLPLKENARGDQVAPQMALVADPAAVLPDRSTKTALLLDRLFAGLTWEERVVLYLYHLAEHKMHFIGQVLRCSESRVSQLHTDVLERLRKRFTPEELWPLARREW